MVHRRCRIIKRRGGDIVGVVGIFSLPNGLQKNAGGGLNGHLKRAIYKCPLLLYVATTVTKPTRTQGLPNLFPDLSFKEAICNLKRHCFSFVSALFLDLAKISCNQK